MKYLIVGLGNPGAEYAMTRHNIGFMVLDRIFGRENFSTSKYGEIAEYRYRGRTYILLKPNTYMNLSGRAVQWHLNANKLRPSELLVVTDDLSLDFGLIRIRTKGSAGGHNGLKNISESIATSDYARLRVGIGNNFNRGNQVDFVLSSFSEEEVKFLPGILDACIDAIRDFGFIDHEHLMSKHNKRVI